MGKAASRADDVPMKPALLLAAAAAIAACAPEAPRPAATRPGMKAEPVVVASVAVTPAVTPAAAPAPEAEPKADPNRELAKRVMRALEDEGKIQAAAIDVTARGGVITLWGTAATQDEKQRASRVAYRVIGVTSVENKLAIASGS
jgi:hypothetical protein